MSSQIDHIHTRTTNLTEISETRNSNLSRRGTRRTSAYSEKKISTADRIGRRNAFSLPKRKKQEAIPKDKIIEEENGREGKRQVRKNPFKRSSSDGSSRVILHQRRKIASNPNSRELLSKSIVEGLFTPIVFTPIVKLIK
ncbi:unnamed protein product, partial [Owenia fusiformis]